MVTRYQFSMAQFYSILFCECAKFLLGGLVRSTFSEWDISVIRESLQRKRPSHSVSVGSLELHRTCKHITLSHHIEVKHLLQIR